MDVCPICCGQMQFPERVALCRYGHAICAACVRGIVKNAQSLDTIKCSHLTCRVPYEASSVAPHLTGADIEHWTRLIRADAEAKALAERPDGGNVDAKTFDSYKRAVEEAILTTRCPSCSQAFLDFDGCCLLTCSRRTCLVKFCAWCHKQFPTSYAGHAHVSKCILGPKENGNGMYCSAETYLKHTRAIQHRQLFTMKHAINIPTGEMNRLLQIAAERTHVMHLLELAILIITPVFAIFLALFIVISSNDLFYFIINLTNSSFTSTFAVNDTNTTFQKEIKELVDNGALIFDEILSFYANIVICTMEHALRLVELLMFLADCYTIA